MSLVTSQNPDNDSGGGVSSASGSHEVTWRSSVLSCPHQMSADVEARPRDASDGRPRRHGTPLAIDPYSWRPPALNPLKYETRRYAGTGLGQSLARKYASVPPSTNMTLPQRK